MRPSRVALLVAALVGSSVAVAAGCSDSSSSALQADAGTGTDAAPDAIEASTACVNRSFSPLVAAGGVIALGAGGNDIVYAVSTGVYRVSKDGGPAAKVADTIGTIAFVGVSAGIVTWARNVGAQGAFDFYLEWRALDGSASGSTHMPAGWTFDYMTVGPDGAYVGVRSVPDTSPVNGIYVFPREGTHAQLVQLIAAGDMFVDGADLWYLTGRNNGTLVRRSLVDGQEMTIARELSGPLVRDAEHVFSDHGAKEIVGISKTTGAVDVSLRLGGIVAPLRPIALLADEIVWSQWNDPFPPFPLSAQDPVTATGLFRARRDGSCLTLLDWESHDLVVSDGKGVYIATRDGVFVLR